MAESGARRRGSREPSLARRLTLQLGAIAALLSFLLYLAVRALSGDAAESTHDGILAASVEAIVERLGAHEGEPFVDLPYGALAMLGAVSDDRVFYRIVSGERTLTGYADLPLPPIAPPPGETVFYDARYKGSAVRIAAASRRVAVGARSVGVVALVAQTLDGQRRIAAGVAARATLLGGGSFALAGLLGAMAVRRSLSPLRRVASGLERRGAHDLAPIGTALPRELAPLGRALDGFMHRLDNTLERTETFIGEAAHHVRTPLAVVRGRAETALRQSDDAAVRDTLRSLVRAVDESARSAEQLLDHAMVAHRSERVPRERLALGPLVRRIVQGVEPLAELRDVRLRTRIDDAVHAVGDRVQIESAVRNLVDNALKYSAPESDIDVSVARCHDAIEIEVRDRGRGIEGLDPARLTERYRRGTNVDDVVGSGLGLAIAAQVASAHGGTLSLTPATGRGTRARLTVPRSE